MKGLKENEWMMDPVVIADAYGPEVRFYLWEVCLVSLFLPFNF